MTTTSLDRRVEAFRSRVFEGIDLALRNSPKGKPYEGTVSLSWPGYFHTHSHARSGVYKLSLSCSLFGMTSHHSWTGKTWREAFAKAHEDLEMWIEGIDAPEVLS